VGFFDIEFHVKRAAQSNSVSRETYNNEGFTWNNCQCWGEWRV